MVGKVSTLLPFVTATQKTTLNTSSHAYDFKGATFPTNCVLDLKQWIPLVPFGTYFFSVHVTEQPQVDPSNSSSTEQIVGIDSPQSCDVHAPMDEGYGSMLNCALGSQLESLQEELELMKEGFKQMVDNYDSKLCSVREEQSKQLEELRTELEKEHHKILEDERNRLKKELKEELEKQKKTYEEQKKSEEQQNKQPCEFAIKEEEYKKKIGEMEEAYRRRVKELVTQEKKMHDLENEFHHLMEDQERKTREIEQKYDNMLHRMQEELEEKSKWSKKKFFPLGK